MTALWVLLGILALGAAALAAPVNVELFYDENGVSTAAHLGPVRLPFPGDAAGRRRKPAQKVKRRPSFKRSKTGPARDAASEEQRSDWRRLLRTHWREAVEALGDLLRRPKLTRLELLITAGGQDPAACAMAYGRCWAAVGSALPLIRSVFQVGKEQIEVACDYQLSKTTARGRAVFTLRVFELLQALLVLLKLVRRLQTPNQITKKAVQQS